MLRHALILALALALPVGAALAQDDPDPLDAPLPIPYGGEQWDIDPGVTDLGDLFQGVVTEVTTTASGTTVRGIVFVHDEGGWRAAGAFEGVVATPIAVGAELVPAVLEG